MYPNAGEVPDEGDDDVQSGSAHTEEINQERKVLMRWAMKRKEEGRSLAVHSFPSHSPSYVLSFRDLDFKEYYLNSLKAIGVGLIDLFDIC